MNETREEGYDVFLLKRKHVSEKMMTTKACEKIKRFVPMYTPIGEITTGVRPESTVDFSTD